MSFSEHLGDRLIKDPVQLQSYALPEKTRTYQPLPHYDAYRLVCDVLEAHYISVVDSWIAVAKGGAQSFFLFQVVGSFQEEFCTMVGFRNSYDKSLSFGMVAGKGTFVCTNLMFYGLVKVTRKHTRRLLLDLEPMLTEVVRGIPEYERAIEDRNQQFKAKQVDHSMANGIIIQAAKQDIIPSSKILPVVREWERPTYEDFFVYGYSLWRLEQAFTTVMRREIFSSTDKSLRLHGMLEQVLYG